MRIRALARTALLVSGCILTCTSACAPRTPRWDTYADAGPLDVRGARRTAPGPRLLRVLERDPHARAAIAANGEPDTLEVVTVRGGGRRIVLTYRRARDGGRRRIVIEPPGALAMAERPRRVPASRGTREASPADVAAEPGRPTPRQSLECPIDPGRADCRTLCVNQTTYEWCR